MSDYELDEIRNLTVPTHGLPKGENSAKGAMHRSLRKRMQPITVSEYQTAAQQAERRERQQRIRSLIIDEEKKMANYSCFRHILCMVLLFGVVTAVVVVVSFPGSRLDAFSEVRKLQALMGL